MISGNIASGPQAIIQSNLFSLSIFSAASVARHCSAPVSSSVTIDVVQESFAIHSRSTTLSSVAAQFKSVTSNPRSMHADVKARSMKDRLRLTS